MFGTVLVPLDGSVLAERAFEYALALARAEQGRLLLYHSSPPLSLHDHPVDERAAALELDALALRSTTEGIACERIVDHSYHGGDPYLAIIDVVRERRPDLIVLASHGREGMADNLRGSAAERVVREAGVAVLVVPAEPRTYWSATEGPRILAPLSDFELSEQALRIAERLGHALGGSLLLAHFVDPAEMSVDIAPIRVASALAIVERLAESVRRKGLDAEAHAVLDDPSGGLLRAAGDWDVGLIVVVTHSRRALGRFLLGSVAGSLVQSARVPTLVVPASIPLVSA